MSNDPEFDALVERMESPEALAGPMVIEVAETASMVEFTIPLEVVAEPEVELFRTITEYLGKIERRAVIVVNCTYELRNGAPFLIATMVLTQPV